MTIRKTAADRSGNDGIAKVLDDLQDKFLDLRKDLEKDIKEFNEKAREHWDSFTHKFDSKEIRKERDRVVRELNKRADAFLKRMQGRIPGVGRLQEDMKKMRGRIARMEAEIEALEKKSGGRSSAPKRKAPARKKD